MTPTSGVSRRLWGYHLHEVFVELPHPHLGPDNSVPSSYCASPMIQDDCRHTHTHTRLSQQNYSPKDSNRISFSSAFPFMH